MEQEHCSIYIHENQYSNMRNRNEKWLMALCSAWKILLESTIRIPANLPLLCSVTDACIICTFYWTLIVYVLECQVSTDCIGMVHFRILLENYCVETQQGSAALQLPYNCGCSLLYNITQIFNIHKVWNSGTLFFNSFINKTINFPLFNLHHLVCKQNEIENSQEWEHWEHRERKN